MMLTLVAGLPASGKTTLLAAHSAAGALVLDDLASLDALPAGPVAWLVVADVNFCVPSVRAAAEAELLRRYPSAEVEWTFFENDPEACLANAERRDDGRNVRPDILSLSRRYEIPDGAEVTPVWRPPAPGPR